MNSTFHEKNLAGLIAGTWGFLFGSAITLTITAATIAWLHGGPVATSIGCIIVAVLTAIGCLLLLGMEWMNPSVHNVGDFFKILRFATLASMLMPVIVFSLMFILVTLPIVLPAYVVFFKLLKTTDYGSKMTSALTN